jgi:SAM-dependent MidA family methyltransferase
MAACNAHYYATRDPLGAAGDFTTAPEISQMFGELVGAALADCWQRAGRPAEVRYVELGPGRGTLAADALRVLARAGLSPPVDLVETSPALREAQKRAVPQAGWHDDLAAVPPGPLLLVANEFLDALPVRQQVGPAERRVAFDGAALRFAPEGELVETSPARDSAVAAIAARLARDGGTALLIDYGYAHPGRGDTLQAVRGHRFADPLADPGEQDLTAHVDFAAVARAARAAGAGVHGPVRQGEWLERLGIAARADALAAAHPDRAKEIAAARRRLCNSSEMGALFKVIALTGGGWPAPAGLA